MRIRRRKTDSRIERLLGYDADSLLTPASSGGCGATNRSGRSTAGAVRVLGDGRAAPVRRRANVTRPDLEELVCPGTVESQLARDASPRLVVGRLQEDRSLAAGQPDPRVTLPGRGS